MIKRFWPLLAIVLLVVLAVTILPAAATLMPKLNKSQYETKIYHTILTLNSPSTNFPGDVREGEPFGVSGYLYYIDTEYLNQYTDITQKGLFSKESISLEAAVKAGALHPLPYRRITVSTEYGFLVLYYNQPNINTHTTRNVFTDKDGYFSATIQIDNIKHWHQWVSAYYEGEKEWAISEGSALPILLEYIPDGDSIPEHANTLRGVVVSSDLSIISIVSYCFAGIFVAIVTYFIYHYRKKLRDWLKRRKAQVVAPEPASTETSLSSPEPVPEVSTGDPRVEILFPQIENPLPPVWGIGEPVTILSRALIAMSEDHIKSSPQIKASDRTLDIFTPGFSPVQLEHTFDRKGEIVINVHFGADNDDKMFGTRKIRIVDYREEIVELFNHLIDSLSAQDIEVDRMMTAREIESQLKEKYPDLLPDTMKDIVKGFEYANYSLYPVARKIYVDMYAAGGKIQERVKNA